MIPISDRLLGVKTASDFAKAIEWEFHALGFSIYSAHVVPNPQIDGQSKWVGHFAMPHSWVTAPEGFHDPVGVTTDPVMQHMKHNSTPIIWGRDDYYAVQQHDQYDFQSSCGLASGISVAMHLPNGRHFCVGADDARDVRRDKHLPELVSRIQMIAIYAQVAAERVFFASAKDSVASLTPRERECLLWASVGKSAWETGAILGIQEQTVMNMRRSIMSKLECTNVTHAVAKGLRLGLI